MPSAVPINSAPVDARVFNDIAFLREISLRSAFSHTIVIIHYKTIVIIIIKNFFFISVYLFNAQLRNLLVSASINAMISLQYLDYDLEFVKFHSLRV